MPPTLVTGSSGCAARNSDDFPTAVMVVPLTSSAPSVMIRRSSSSVRIVVSV